MIWQDLPVGKGTCKKQVDCSKINMSTNILRVEGLLQKRLGILNNNKTLPHYKRVTTLILFVFVQWSVLECERGETSKSY